MSGNKKNKGQKKEKKSDIDKLKELFPNWDEEQLQGHLNESGFTETVNKILSGEFTPWVAVQKKSQKKAQKIATQTQNSSVIEQRVDNERREKPTSNYSNQKPGPNQSSNQYQKPQYSPVTQKPPTSTKPISSPPPTNIIPQTRISAPRSQTWKTWSNYQSSEPTPTPKATLEQDNQLDTNNFSQTQPDESSQLPQETQKPSTQSNIPLNQTQTQPQPKSQHLDQTQTQPQPQSQPKPQSKPQPQKQTPLQPQSSPQNQDQISNQGQNIHLDLSQNSHPPQQPQSINYSNQFPISDETSKNSNEKVDSPVILPNNSTFPGLALQFGSLGFGVEEPVKQDAQFEQKKQTQGEVEGESDSLNYPPQMNPMNFAYFNQFQMNQMNQMGPLQGYVPPMHPMNFYDLDPSQQRFMYFDPSQGYRVPKQDPQSLPGQQNPQNLQQQQQQQQQQNAQPYMMPFQFFPYPYPYQQPYSPYQKNMYMQQPKNQGNQGQNQYVQMHPNYYQNLGFPENFAPQRNQGGPNSPNPANSGSTSPPSNSQSSPQTQSQEPPNSNDDSSNYKKNSYTPAFQGQNYWRQ